MASGLLEPETFLKIETQAAQRPNRTPASLHLCSILTIAATLRVVLDWFMIATKAPSWFWVQGSELAVLGDNLQAGLGLSSPFGGNTGPSAFLAPGYPALVALDFALFHPYSRAAFIALVVVQTLFSLAAIWLLMVITKKMFGNMAANIAGAVLAINPPMLWIDVFFWETSLSLLSVCAILALTLNCAERPSMKLWLALAATSALALLTNPSLLTFVGCCILWTLWQTRNTLTTVSRTAPIAAALLFLAIFAPWPIRNLRKMHAFIPLRSNMGYEMWQGNRPGADGYFRAELHPNMNRIQLRELVTQGEVAYMHSKSEAAKAAILADPVRFAALTGRRIVRFWTGKSRVYSSIVVAQISITSILGLLGLAMLYHTRRDLFTLFLPILLFFPLPYYLTHPDFRFRLVIDPILLALTSLVLVTAIKSRQPGTA